MKTLWHRLQLQLADFESLMDQYGLRWRGEQSESITFEQLMRKVAHVRDHDYIADSQLMSHAMLAIGATGPVKAELHACYQQMLMSHGWTFPRYDSRTTFVIRPTVVREPTEQLDAESLRQLEESPV